MAARSFPVALARATLPLPSSASPSLLSLTPRLAKRDACPLNLTRDRVEDACKRVYVIGHPGGRSLTFSLADNLVLGFRDPKLHYRAPTEGGSSDRENLSAQWNYKPSATEEWSAQLWGSRYHLRLFSDFTFFKDGGLRFYRPTPGGPYVDRCANLGVNCPELPDGSIALSQFIPSDGIEQDFLAFNSGAIATIKIAARKAHLIARE